MMDLVPDEIPIRLVIAGDGADRGPMSQRAARTRSRDRIFFTGSIEERDLPDVYRSCDIFALISDRGYGRGEGIPLTPLEAAACGKPILVGNQDGSREAAEHGVSGFVLEPFDLEGLAQLLVRLVRDPELRARVGRAAHERIAREHSYDRFRERTRDLVATLKIS
jgi:phosphatidylinositol alpha-1,6-mannosyltransferase